MWGIKKRRIKRYLSLQKKIATFLPKKYRKVIIISQMRQFFYQKRAVKYRKVTEIGQIRQFLAKSGNSQTSFMMGIKKRRFK